MDQEEPILDPTLAGCCAQDAKDRKKGAELRALLRSHDIASNAVAARREAGALSYIPEEKCSASCDCHPNTSVTTEDFDMFDSDLDMEDEDDEILLEFQQARLNELQKMAMAREENLTRKTGQLHQVSETQFQEELKSSTLPIVCHIGRKSSNVSESINSYFSEKSKVYVGTKFRFVDITKSTQGLKMLETYQLNKLPTVLCFRQSTLIDKYTNFKDLDHRDFWDRVFELWLMQCHVLEKEVLKSSSDTIHENGGDSSDDEEIFDCGKEGCRLRHAFAHEHVVSSE